MTRDQIFCFVLSGYSSPVDGAVVREATARQRFNKVKAFIDGNVPKDGKRSPANLFGDQGAMRAFLSTTPLSNRSRICVCFEEILSHLSLSLSSSSPCAESVRHIVPTLLRRCKTKANSSYRTQRAEMKDGESINGQQEDFKDLQARAVAESVPRLKDILILAFSYLHEVRADEKLAARILSELDLPETGKGDPEGDCEFSLSPSDEDDFVFGTAFSDATKKEAAACTDKQRSDDKCETDEAGRFLRLQRFPESLFSEATGILMMLANISVKPERSSSFREMTTYQALELEQSQTCELRVKKVTASFKYSQCVVTKEVAELFRDYRLSLKVLVSNKLKRCPSPLPGERYKEDIKRLHDQCLDEPLLTKLREPQRLRVWRSVQKALLDKGVSLTMGQIQSVYNVISYYYLVRMITQSYICFSSSGQLQRRIFSDSKKSAIGLKRPDT